MKFVMAEALKPSLRGEFIFQQTIGEEIWCLNANANANAVVAGGGGGEDFAVEDLFDFSNGDSLHDEEEEKDNSSLSSHSQDSTNSNSTGVSNDSIFSAELTVPAGDLDDLEWVSHFVDDSLSLPELSLLYPVISEQKITFAEPEPVKKTQTPLCFLSEVKITTKARSVKSRKPNPRVRSLSPLLTRSSSPSSCSSVLSSSTAPPPVAPPAKKLKRKAEEVEGAGAQSQRRCSHCQVQKTPQWRTGPLGAKTLCNACGVRYKSGRLCSEYRPACSPTFCGEIHSNSHRKVLEIRRRKEVVGPDAGLTPTQMVPTC